MTNLAYRRERIKRYEALLAKWRKSAADYPELLDDIRDLERHVNQIRGTTVERDYTKQVGRPSKGAYRIATEPREASRDQSSAD